MKSSNFQKIIQHEKKKSQDCLIVGIIFEHSTKAQEIKAFLGRKTQSQREQKQKRKKKKNET